MTYTEKEWREYSKSSGRGGEVDSQTWLTNGCPFCDCKSWQVTNDHWAYCDSCNKGFPTRYAMTNSPLAILKSDGSIAPVTFDNDGGGLVSD